MLNVLFSAKPYRWDEYEKPLRTAFEQAGLDVNLSTQHRAEDVDYIVFAPNGPVQDFSPYIKTRAVMSLWAGVETVVGNKTLTQPLVRMVDDGLTQGMVEWVVGHVMRHHLGIDGHIHGQDGVWRELTYPPLAKDRVVTILGVGALGAACGQAISTLGFQVRGWSRSAKQIDGVQCFHGSDGLRAALDQAEIVVALLPQTDDTENTLDADRIGLMAKGGFIINPGRGPLIDDKALLDALESGQIAHATLDVFRIEPLPVEHPFWAHPNVTVTPHIASFTRPDTAAQIIAKNIKTDQAGMPLPNVVDRQSGY